MYYGKKTSANNDYYNAYTNNSYQSENERGYLTLILKLLIIIFLLGVLFVGYLFVSDRAKTVDKKVTTVEKSVKTKISKDISKEKATVVKNKKSTETKLTQEEIAMIIQAVMSNMNKEQTNISADEVADDAYTKNLLSQDVDSLDNSNRREITKNSLSLKDTNHYNKVIINRPKNETYTNDTLSQLSSEISSIIDDSTQEDSSYTKEITREIAVRSNEMRFIVVEDGDTLSKIAYRAYGNYDAYEKIFEANPEVIQNPDQIYAGQKLRIPL